MIASADFSYEIVADDVSAVSGLLKEVATEPVLPPVIPLQEAGDAAGRRETLVFISADSLSAAAPFVSEAARLHRLRSLIVSVDDPRWLPQLLHRANLRTLRNTFAHEPDDTAPRRRILYAHLLGAENDLIASALVERDILLVLTCALDTIEVPFADHPALARLSRPERPRFHLSEEGHRIFWDDGRVALDLEGLRYASDAAYRTAVDRRSAHMGATYGDAIRSLRLEHGLRQSDIDGLSERQVRRIERDGTSSPTALQALADAHGLPLPDYLNELADRSASREF